jgi:acetolactate synthase-1/2/3 large subunit
MRVADYVAQTLAQKGICHVFMVTGGGAMHLNDAIGRNKDLTYICCHHEQAGAMAAESYYRLTNRLAAVNVTTGPGGTNAITGVFGAWTDSLGMIVISGQVKWETLVQSTGLRLRQLGDQEVDIIRLVEPITKYAVMVTDPPSIRYHLEKALHLAVAGRPGPVWLDIPINVQAALIDPKALKGYDPGEDEPVSGAAVVSEACAVILQKLKDSKRPVILAGGGVWRAQAQEKLVSLSRLWKIPVTTAWNAHDLITDDHPFYIGRPGTVGDRAGNFAVQNADFLLALGCRLNIRQVSYAWENFAKNAWKAVVDIDPLELQKPTVKPDLPVCADVGEALVKLIEAGPQEDPEKKRWLEWCLERKKKYPVVLDVYRKNKKKINPYVFMETLFAELPENQVTVTGDGTACVVSFQTARIKKGQRLYTNSGCAPMGYDLPAAIGACVALDKKPVVCLAGDGSIQLNLQELQTIVGYRLPVKIFVLNNQGYHSIRQTQSQFFPDNPVGCDPKSGVSFPDFKKLAWAYGIDYHKIDKQSQIKKTLAKVLSGRGAQLCEVMLDPDQPYAPKLASKKLEDGTMVSPPLEDMAPFLSREELNENKIKEIPR